MSKKKLKNIIVWSAALLYLVVMAIVVAGKSSETPCHRVEIAILDSAKHYFIEPQDVRNILSENDILIYGRPITEINTNEIEKVLVSRMMIREAEVYMQADGVLSIDVLQRNPLVRVIDKNGDSFYIDELGKIVPVSSKYTPHVLLVNGNIEKPKDVFSVNEPNEKYVNKKNAQLLKDIFKMVKFISQDDLWKAQFEQLYVTDDYEFELIPKVGSHVIAFGDINLCETKFKKLRALYYAGFNNFGWNKYETINLKYSNQVICTKR